MYFCSQKIINYMYDGLILHPTMYMNNYVNMGATYLCQHAIKLHVNIHKSHNMMLHVSLMNSYADIIMNHTLPFLHVGGRNMLP